MGPWSDPEVLRRLAPHLPAAGRALKALHLEERATASVSGGGGGSAARGANGGGGGMARGVSGGGAGAVSGVSGAVTAASAFGGGAGQEGEGDEYTSPRWAQRDALGCTCWLPYSPAVLNVTAAGP